MWGDDPGMTKDMIEYLMTGTEMGGFRIWEINIQYRTVNVPTELKPINSKVVVEIITWILRRSEGRLVCLGFCMWVEGAQSEYVKSETAK